MDNIEHHGVGAVGDSEPRLLGNGIGGCDGFQAAVAATVAQGAAFVNRHVAELSAGAGTAGINLFFDDNGGTDAVA